MKIFGTPTQLPGSTSATIREASTWAILAVVALVDAINVVNYYNDHGVDILIAKTNGEAWPSGQSTLRFDADYTYTDATAS